MLTPIFSANSLVNMSDNFLSLFDSLLTFSNWSHSKWKGI